MCDLTQELALTNGQNLKTPQEATFSTAIDKKDNFTLVLQLYSHSDKIRV